jgi:hypothetical protein
VQGFFFPFAQDDIPDHVAQSANDINIVLVIALFLVADAEHRDNLFLPENRHHQFPLYFGMAGWQPSAMGQGGIVIVDNRSARMDAVDPDPGLLDGIMPFLAGKSAALGHGAA